MGKVIVHLVIYIHQLALGIAHHYQAEAAWVCAQSRAKVEALKNFLFAYFLYT
jgi:hypothetical protein